MISPKFKAGCGVLVVFALGFVLGAVCLVLLLVKVVPLSEGWKSRESREFVARHLARQLQLTEEQKASFRPLVDEFLARRWSLRRDYLLEERRLVEEEFLPRAEEDLTEEQRQRARRMLERWQRDQRFKLAPEEGGPVEPAAPGPETGDAPAGPGVE